MSFIKHLLPNWKVNLERRGTANTAILESLNNELTEAEQDTIKGKVVMSLETSTGEWLDQYGKIFGLTRKDEESDDAFRERIIAYVQLERGTIPAIIAAIREFLLDYESHIEIYEPYTNIFFLNKSKLNGKDHILGYYYTYAVIDIRFTRPFPRTIMEVINDFKPAGVRVFLTYRPSAFNPYASIISMSLDSSTVKKTSSKLRIMNGMSDWVRGHLNLTKRTREDDDSGIFITNSSHLNSRDRLTGAFFVTNPSYNLASVTNESLDIDDNTSVTDIFNQTEPLTSDFYTQTGELNEQYAAYTFLTSEEDREAKYIHFSMDMNTYLTREYYAHMREVNPSGLYGKEDYLQLTEKPNIQYSLATTTPVTRPTEVNIQLFNFNTSKWETVKTEEVSINQVTNKVDIGSLEPFLNSGGTVLSRMTLNAHRDTETCDIRLYFFEIGFSKFVAARPTISPYEPEISGQATVEDIE